MECLTERANYSELHKFGAKMLTCVYDILALTGRFLENM